MLVSDAVLICSATYSCFCHVDVSRPLSSSANHIRNSCQPYIGTKSSRRAADCPTNSRNISSHSLFSPTSLVVRLPNLRPRHVARLAALARTRSRWRRQGGRHRNIQSHSLVSPISPFRTKVRPTALLHRHALDSADVAAGPRLRHAARLAALARSRWRRLGERTVGIYRRTHYFLPPLSFSQPPRPISSSSFITRQRQPSCHLKCARVPLLTDSNPQRIGGFTGAEREWRTESQAIAVLLHVEQALGFVDVQTMEKDIFKCSKTWKKEEIHKKS